MAMILSLLLCSAFAVEVDMLNASPTPTAVRSIADAHEWPVSVETLPNDNDAEFEWFTAASGKRYWFPRKTRIVFSYEPEEGPLAAVQAAVAAHRSAGSSMDFRIESDDLGVVMIATHAPGPDGQRTAKVTPLSRPVTVNGETMPFLEAVGWLMKQVETEAQPITFGMIPLNHRTEITLPKGTMPAREALRAAVRDLDLRTEDADVTVRWVMIWADMFDKYIMSVEINQTRREPEPEPEERL